MHRALDPFTSNEIKQHSQVSLLQEGRKGGSDYRSTDHRLTEYRHTDNWPLITGYWFTDYRHTSHCHTDPPITDTPVTDHYRPSTVDYGLTNRSLMYRLLFSSLQRDVHRQLACRRISEAGGGLTGYRLLITDYWVTDYLVTEHQPTDHYRPSTVDYGLTNRSLITDYHTQFTAYDWLYSRKPKNPV
ncbi:MAG: hypothetical protein RIC35_00775 [Marinoscillum sp.]